MVRVHVGCIGQGSRTKQATATCARRLVRCVTTAVKVIDIYRVCMVTHWSCQMNTVMERHLQSRAWVIYGQPFSRPVEGDGSSQKDREVPKQVVCRAVPLRPATLTMAHSLNSWFGFSCTKPRSHRSSLLEANLAAKSETVAGCVPCESDESVSDANASLISEASTAPGMRDGTPPKRRASFADQQHKPLVKMCAPFCPNLFLVPSAPFLTSRLPAQILCPLSRRARGDDGRETRR